MKANHHNLWWFIIVLSIAISSILFVSISRRLDRIERELDTRAPLVEEFLQMAVQTKQNTLDIQALFLHHIELQKVLHEN